LVWFCFVWFCRELAPRRKLV